jgi:hypothetical protein
MIIKGFQDVRITWNANELAQINSEPGSVSGFSENLSLLLHLDLKERLSLQPPVFPGSSGKGVPPVPFTHPALFTQRKNRRRKQWPREQECYRIG